MLRGSCRSISSTDICLLYKSPTYILNLSFLVYEMKLSQEEIQCLLFT